MKENWKLIGFCIFFISLIVFMVWGMTYQRETQKNVLERDGHTYDRVFIQTSPHIVPSPECELCRRNLDSIINVKVDSILEANGIKK